MVRLAAYLLFAVGIGHALTGVASYRQPLEAMLREGFVNSVRPHLDRRAAFWFILFSAMFFMAGQVTLHAAETGDAYLLKLVGWYFFAIGAVGVLAMPKSPFWIGFVISAILLWSAHDLAPPL